MTASKLPPGRAAARRPEAGTAGAGRLRLAIYTAALGIGFALFLLVEGPGQPLAFWLCGAGAGAALGIGLYRPSRLLRAGAVAALALALSVPLVPAFWENATGGAFLSAAPLWPQMLVALLASRVLAEDSDLRFARFWQAPLATAPAVEAQSALAAVALGAFFTLAFYQVLWWVAPERSGAVTLSSIVLNALTGQTPVHRGIVFLFFTILAFALDAALHYRRDRATLTLLQAAAARRADLRAVLAADAAPFAHTRTSRLIQDALDTLEPQPPSRGALATAAFEGFHLASRRFIRGLLPFLPLLGFFGTVIGLATAMAALPTSASAGGSIDISGSLAGLAVKFETTLLGIMASMIAAFVLGMLERRETELAAACALLVGAAGLPAAGLPAAGALLPSLPHAP